MFWTNFRPRSLKKELGQFSQKSLTPDMQKKFKKSSKIEKFFIARNTFKYLSLRQQHHLRCFGHVSGQGLSKKNLVNFHKNLWPQVCKNNSKNYENRKKFFFLETTLNTLVYVSNPIWDVLDKFQAKILPKITLSIFTKISDTGYAKKFKKSWK